MENISDQDLGIPAALNQQLSRQQSIYTELSRNLLRIQELTPLKANQAIKYKMEVTENQDILKWLSRVWAIMRRLQEANIDKISSALQNKSRKKDVTLVNDILRHTTGA